MKRFGVNTYGGEGDLVGARPDAERMCALLKDSFDEVAILTDFRATKSAILED